MSRIFYVCIVFLGLQVAGIAAAPRAAEAAQISVVSCSLNPSTIAIGGQSVLTVTISGPAPAGGVQTAIQLTSDGAQDTLIAQPSALPVVGGQTSATFLLQTRRVDGYAHKITFYAFSAGTPAKAATLTIS